MTEYDQVIRGGIIADGTGIPRYRADLAVKNGRVAQISGRISSGGAKEIDANGCIVAPGAINGTITFEKNNATRSLPGKLLRSYDRVS